MFPDSTDPHLNKRLLVVTDNRFWLNRIGSNVRILTMLQHLRAHGWNVSVAFMGYRYTQDNAALAALSMPVSFSLGSAAEPGPSTPAAKANPAAGRSLRQRVKGARDILRASLTQWERPFPEGGFSGVLREIGLRANARRVSDFRDPRHVDCVQGRIKQDHPDWVLVEYFFWGWLRAAVQPTSRPGLRWAVDTHDIQYERQQRFHALGEAHGVDITRKEESRWLNEFDLVIAIHARDAAHLQTMVPRRTVVCAMHPQDAIAGLPTTTRSSGLAVGFLGSGMTPNTLAARELIEKIWPVVLTSGVAGVRLLVAGSVCEQLRGSALPPNVLLLGVVSNLDAFYDDVDILACPIRIGGGLKIKNVEALCRGKALVTTAVGAEGMEEGARTAYLLAEDPMEFSTTIAQLLDDHQLRQKVSTAALKYAQSHFEPAVTFAALMAALDSPVQPSSDFHPFASPYDTS